eukprot:GDKJ01026545.1.p1 GENE.GDKJ01026545.1~~GDKJ01026545.1.p1  ORF type:complete len:435 (-),score=103.57 GDKJ01026545.1:60-1364(-)
MAKSKGSKSDVREKRTTKNQKKRKGSELEDELENSGLYVKRIQGDGNCLFRSFADQLTGEEDRHHEFRSSAVSHIRENASFFGMWLGEDLEDYLSEMQSSGTWGGQIEIHALSQMYRVNVLVHQDQPKTWLMENFDAKVYPCVQISYHGHSHYNSVRFLDESHLKKPTLLTLEKLKERLKGGSSSPSKPSDSSSEDLSKLKDLRRLVPPGVSDGLLEEGLRECRGDVYEASAWVAERMEELEVKEEEEEKLAVNLLVEKVVEMRLENGSKCEVEIESGKECEEGKNNSSELRLKGKESDELESCKKETKERENSVGELQRANEEGAKEDEFGTKEEEDESLQSSSEDGEENQKEDDAEDKKKVPARVAKHTRRLELKRKKEQKLRNKMVKQTEKLDKKLKSRMEKTISSENPTSSNAKVSNVHVGTVLDRIVNV